MPTDWHLERLRAVALFAGTDPVTCFHSWGQYRGGGPAHVPRGEAAARRFRHENL
jgi:hypothetical protein